MYNDLFNQTLMKKYSSQFKLSPSNHDIIKEWNGKLERGELESERSNHPVFQNMILMGVLGYNLDEIEYEKKEGEGLGRPDFVLKDNNKEFMVIELKGQKINMDKGQMGRADNKTPVKQAFDYAENTEGVEWVFVSNYDEFRLYNWHKRKQKYISFKASELLDKEIFSYFMLIFSKESHLKDGLIDKLFEKTLVVERELEKEFYKLYNETRLMLMRELEEFNNFVRDGAIHYAQLILNRYMFVSFAEDTGLLPSQISTDTIVTPIKKGNLRHRSIWQRLNELFLDINEGNPYKKISGYNGGLFEEDLDSIQIRDIVDDHKIFQDVWQDWGFEVYEKDIMHLMEPYGDKINPIYKNLLTISSFDFSSELDVNILGHIFENSIGDLEELKEDVRGRRKKEGIFYTPEYITDYICRNTIIPYLSKSGNADSVEELISEYSDGDEIDVLESQVMGIKIVDPACGSGAFLNKAADVLLETHKAIYDFKKEKYTTTIETRGGKGKGRVKREAKHVKLDSYFDQVNTRREILIHNIYGVDLNAESVDITKLSLFLKVCQKDRKLPELDNNIKCGNSLIDDSEYTDKPFNWKKQFPEIFKDDEGGFDVVIGNPPYVRQEKIKEIKPYLRKYYMVYTGVADLYVYFFEKGLDLLNKGGKLGFISSNRFIRSNYGKKLMELISNNSKFEKYFDHTYDDVFEDATTYPSIFILQKGNPADNELIVNEIFSIEQSRLIESGWIFEPPEILDLRDKIYNQGIEIKEIEEIKIFYGIKTGFNNAFFIDKNIRIKLIKENPNSEEIIKPLIRGKDIKRWGLEFKDIYLIFTRRGINIENYSAIKNYLEQFKEMLLPRNAGQRIGRKSGDYEWYEIQDTVDYFSEFEKTKLIYPVIASRLYATYDDRNFYLNDKGFMITSNDINLKFLGALLSSKTLHFVFKFFGSRLQGKHYELRKIFVEQLPIYPATPEQQQPLIEKADKMLQLNRALQEEVKGFQDWLQHTFNIEKLSKKLEKYYELSLDEFLAEVKKKKVDVKSRKNYQTFKNEFEDSLAKVQPLLREIALTDDEIDRMVYELYGLTEEEIGIIEDSLN